jgi:uncharacterized OsmC-like protein
MRIAASVRNAGSDHRVTVSTSGVMQRIEISAKPTGQGSSINGGEFLLLALATCYCNDVYREAARLGIPVASVEVEAQADFDGVGLAAKNISYRARVESPASCSSIEELLRCTDAVAEVHNTVRAGVAVSFVPWSTA